jgi:hypothetical protein
MNEAIAAPARPQRYGWAPLAIAAALLLAGAPVLHRSSRDDTGPLALGGHGSSSSGGQVVPGQWLVTTIITGPLAGPTPAVVEVVEPADPRQGTGVRFRYAVLVEDQRGEPGAVRGWPPKPYSIAPLRGFVVQPGHALHIAVGGAALGLGTYRIDRFTVYYHVGAKRYATTLPEGLVLRSRAACAACQGGHQLDGAFHPQI